MENDTKFCTSCGEKILRKAVICPKYGCEQTRLRTNYTDKNRVMAALLAFFVGVFGVHWFYIGKKIYGIIMLLCAVLSQVFIFYSIILIEYLGYSKSSDFSILLTITILILSIIGLVALVVVSIINGIIFLTQSDEQFNKKYLDYK